MSLLPTSPWLPVSLLVFLAPELQSGDQCDSGHCQLHSQPLSSETTCPTPICLHLKKRVSGAACYLCDLTEQCAWARNAQVVQLLPAGVLSATFA